MKIEVTWNKPDGTKAVVGTNGSGTDTEMELHKAVAAAIAHFNQLGSTPPLDQLTARIVEK